MGGTSRENSADSWGREGELSLVIQLTRQKTQGTGAYLGPVKQKKTEMNEVGTGQIDGEKIEKSQGRERERDVTYR